MNFKSAIFLLIANVNFIYFCFAQKTNTYLTLDEDYKKGIELFDKKLFNAAQESFNKFISKKENKNSLDRIDAEFFSAACALELFHKDGEWRFKKFIKEHPGSNRIKWAYFYLGKSGFRKKKYEEVIKWLEQVEVYDLNKEDLAELYFKRGYAYFETGKFSKAQNDFYEIKDINNKYADPANYYYSHIAYQDKNYETAADGFRRLLKNKTFGPVVPYYISQIYFLQAKYDSVIQLAPSLLNDTMKVLKRGEICKIIGESYFKKSRYKEAISYLKEYGGNSQQDNYTLGFAYYQTGNLQDAGLYFSNSVTGNDSLAQSAWYHLADCQIKTGEKNKARNSFFLANKTGQDERIKEDALFNFAKLSYELSLDPFNDAINAFNMYIQNYPTSPRKDEAYKYLVNVFSYTKNYTEAMRAIDKMENPDLSLKNTYQRMAWNLATNFFNLNQNDSARYYYKIVRNKGADAGLIALSNYWEGEINYREKNYNTAIDQFKLFQNNAISAALDEYSIATYNLGYCYYSLKEFDKAKSYFDLFLKKPNDQVKMADAAARMGDCWFIANDFANAAENYEHAIQIGKKDVEYCMYQKAICSGRQKNYQEKIVDLKNLIEKFPNSSLTKSTYLEIAESYVRNNEYDKAIDWYNDFLVKFPESGMDNSIKAQIAVLYENLNNKEKALEYFTEILSKDPKSQE
ncbi:MAG: tetratricopeptide repeat protein, partial [Bacteroidota bacterium]